MWVGCCFDAKGAIGSGEDSADAILQFLGPKQEDARSEKKMQPMLINPGRSNDSSSCNGCNQAGNAVAQRLRESRH